MIFAAGKAAAALRMTFWAAEDVRPISNFQHISFVCSAWLILLPIPVFTHGCAYSVFYAVVFYAQFAYIVAYDFLELKIVVLLCLIRQLELKTFSVLFFSLF